MQGLCAVSDSSKRLMSAAGALALLPLAIFHSGVPAPLTTTQFAHPVMTGAPVRIATRPLDLASLTAADFGDNDAGH